MGSRHEEVGDVMMCSKSTGVDVTARVVEMMRAASKILERMTAVRSSREDDGGCQCLRCEEGSGVPWSSLH